MATATRIKEFEGKTCMPQIPFDILIMIKPNADDILTPGKTQSSRFVESH